MYWYDRPTASLNDGERREDSVIEEVPELEFFDVLPTVWDDTKVIHSDVGKLGTIARKMVITGLLELLMAIQTGWLLFH